MDPQFERPKPTRPDLTRRDPFVTHGFHSRPLPNWSSHQCTTVRLKFVLMSCVSRVAMQIWLTAVPLTSQRSLSCPCEVRPNEIYVWCPATSTRHRRATRRAVTTTRVRDHLLGAADTSNSLSGSGAPNAPSDNRYVVVGGVRTASTVDFDPP